MSSTTPSSIDTSGLEYHVPAGETPAGTCRHCDRPFRTERALALHLEKRHAAALNAREAAAADEAADRERDDLFYYHAKVVGALGALYSSTVIVYMVAFGSGII
ncbi:MAG: hypothetical protein ABEH59_07790 [Halobacteriales archaeon]